MAALATVPLLLTAIWYAVHAPADAPPPVTVPPSVSPLPLPSLRSRPERPANVGKLPAERGIGGAVLLLPNHGSGLVEIVGGDGGLYNILVPDDQRLNEPSLSPDGRWLTWTTVTATIVRDLTTTTVRELPPSSSPPFWSPSGAWFLLPATPIRGDLLYRMPDWTAYPLALTTPQKQTSAVLDSGELLRSASPVSRTAARVELTDPFTGALRPITVDTAGLLADTESLGDLETRDGSPVQIGILAGVADIAALWVEPEESRPGGTVGRRSMIEFSTRDGRALRRLDLVSDVVAWPFCYQGGDLLWSDGTSLRRRPAGAAHDELVMPLDQSAKTKPPGCRDAM